MADEVQKVEATTAEPKTASAPITIKATSSTVVVVESTIKSILLKVVSAIWMALKSIFSLTNIKKFLVWVWTKIKSIFTAMKSATAGTWIKWLVGLGLIFIVGGILFGVLKCDIAKKAVAKYEEVTGKGKTKELKKNQDLIDIINQVDETIK